MAKLILKAGREKSLLRFHPWIFSGAVARIEGQVGTGETVPVHAHDGRFLGWAAHSPSSQIVARVWSWQFAEPVDAALLERRLIAALALRSRMLPTTTSLRLVHGESDGLPGVIVDRYGETLVAQFSSAGAAHWREVLTEILLRLTGLSEIYERSDAEVMALEGLVPRTGVLHGNRVPAPLRIEEHGLRFIVNVTQGHKTGFYLDQRENRLILRQLCAGREVLDCFSYTGAFMLNALAGGAAQVTAVEASAEALQTAQANLGINGLDDGRARLLEGDVFKELRLLRDQARQFDVIVLDPPKFAPTAAHAERAARGYKDINLLALKLLRPGGLLLTFSCSGGVSRELFQKIVAGAAVDAKLDTRILRYLSAGPDHPIALNFPEGEYLKGLLCQIG